MGMDGRCGCAGTGGCVEGMVGWNGALCEDIQGNDPIDRFSAPGGRVDGGVLRPRGAIGATAFEQTPPGVQPARLIPSPTELEPIVRLWSSIRGGAVLNLAPPLRGLITPPPLSKGGGGGALGHKKDRGRTG